MKTFPPPGADALRLSDRLVDTLRKRIAQNGPLSFDDYMRSVLYDPALGYYNNGCYKFGAQGDFITAPELSPLFAQCIANYVAPLLTQHQEPVILEVGAGNGQLAVDCLRHLHSLQALPKHYYILEISAQLRACAKATIQQQIPEFSDRVVWLTSLPDEPWQGVLIANEVLDAMPVKQFRFQDNLLCEVRVDYQQDNFCYCTSSPSTALTKAVDALALTFSADYQSEVNLHVRPWLAALADHFVAGEMLLIDYGFLRQSYYHPQRHMGTLMCHYRHRAHSDPFFYPGLQDITAHVDFTSVGDAALAVGLKVKGFMNQASFLLENGLVDALSNCQDEVTRLAYANQIKQLTLPQEMGELFKVMILSR